MEGFGFAQPWVFLLLPLALLLLWAAERRRGRRAVPFGATAVMTKPGNIPASQLAATAGTKRLRQPGFSAIVAAFSPFFIRLAVAALLLAALARPQFGSTETKRRTLGLDIMLVVDTSGSMRALDLAWEGQRMDRLEVLKNVIKRFVEKRTDDRLGMVVFGTEAFIQAPLTLDHDVLQYFMESLEIGMAGDNTAIGQGLATAVARLKDAKVAAPIVILLTDGEQTAGTVDPRTAAEAAKTFGIKVYTIGLGSDSYVPMHVGGGMYQNVAVTIDEDLLKDIAATTGGRYFNAKTTEDLVEIYDTIDQLEKSEVEIATFHSRDERFRGFVYGAAALVAALVALSGSRWRRVPG